MFPPKRFHFLTLFFCLFYCLHAADPYQLPNDHPLRSKLDALFSKERVTATMDTLKKGGFKPLPLRKWDNVVVAKHKKLK